MKKLIAYLCIIAALLSALTVGCEKKREADFSRLTYIALGDSITEGTDGTSPMAEKVKTPYPRLVEAELGLKKSLNYGIGGSTVSGGEGSFFPMCERFGHMADGDIISVFGGVNDFGQSLPLGEDGDEAPSTFYGALRIIAAGLKEKYPRAFIFFITPYRCSGVPYINSRLNVLKDFAEAVKSVCEEYCLPCLDFFELGGFEEEMNLKGSDGIHPSEEFYKTRTAPQIAEFIRKNYRAQQIFTLGGNL